MMTCHIGDCRKILPTLPRVQMCVTSPPYWGLRDYGVDGQLGLERTPEEYVANLVQVFRLVRDILDDDGTLWLNLGDSYAGSWSGNSMRPEGGTQRPGRPGMQPLDARYAARSGATGFGCKPKDLMGIPWRVALAIQADGWYLRSDIIWSKPNPMPESVTDRPTKAHEYLFLLAKSERYYYDADAISETANYGTDLGLLRGKQFVDGVNISAHAPSIKARQDAGIDSRSAGNGKRNKRSVWTIATQPYSEAHFATFPPALIEPCILAGSRPGDLVLDPFFGSGTVGEVCERLGRKWLGIELNPKYAELWKSRTAQQGLSL